MGCSAALLFCGLLVLTAGFFLAWTVVEAVAARVIH
jgi:membrane protein implicated in regulation of membrane protease activity